MLTTLFPPARLLRVAVVACLLGVGVVAVTSAPAGAGAAAPPRHAADHVSPRVPAADKLTAEELDAPGISGPATAAPHTLVRLKAANLPKGAAALWSIYPRRGADVATTAGTLLEFVAPPGAYEVELTVISTGEAGLSARRVYHAVTIGAGPPPGTPPPEPKAGKLDPVQAIGRIQFGNSSCTATVIGPRRPDGKWDILTASHCMSGVGAKGTFNVKDGRKLPVRVVVHQTRPDLAWLVTTDAVDALPFANVAAENPAAGVKVWHQGYGRHLPGNREDGSVSYPENGEGRTQFKLSVSPGDSGGGILRTDSNEVISTVCCTTRLDGFGDVWGASVRSIRAARPGVVNLDELPVPADDSGPLPAECRRPALLETLGRILDQLGR